MYTSFFVSHFRCFRELRLKELARFNLFVGRNNVGKTALLEALFLHAGAYNPELALRISAFRGIEVLSASERGGENTPWDGLFHALNTQKTIALEGEDETHHRRIIKIRQVRELGELSRIFQTIPSQQPDGGQPVSPAISGAPVEPAKQLMLSSEFARVLEWEHVQDNKSSKYYLVITPLGMQITTPPAPPFPAIFQSARLGVSPRERAERFGRLQLLGRKNLLLKALRSIEPRLKDISEIFSGGQPLLYGALENTEYLLPLQFMGEGMVRLADLILNLVNVSNGVLLVDEIETGFHYSVLPKVWQTIAEAGRERNTQVFATTHSRECVVAAHQAFSENGTYDFQLFRLELNSGGEIQAVACDRESLEAIIEQEWEVR
jgi:hypothetical protein